MTLAACWIVTETLALIPAAVPVGVELMATTIGKVTTPPDPDEVPFGSIWVTVPVAVCPVAVIETVAVWPTLSHG